MSDKKSEVRVKHETHGQPPAPVRTSPFAALRNEIDRLFDDFEWPGFRMPIRRSLAAMEPFRQWSQDWVNAPAIDFVERDDEFELRADLPGMTPEEIEVKLGDGVLTVRGEKSGETTEEKEDYHYRERSYGAFQRSLSLPSDIDADKVEARFENGVLTVRLPKSAEAREKERKIEIKAA